VQNTTWTAKTYKRDHVVEFENHKKKDGANEPLVMTMDMPSVTQTTMDIPSLENFSIHVVVENWEDYEYDFFEIPLHLKFEMALALHHKFGINETDLYCIFGRRMNFQCQIYLNLKRKKEKIDEQFKSSDISYLLFKLQRYLSTCFWDYPIEKIAC